LRISASIFATVVYGGAVTAAPAVAAPTAAANAVAATSDRGLAGFFIVDSLVCSSTGLVEGLKVGQLFGR
jgi:hypothetical protein